MKKTLSEEQVMRAARWWYQRRLQADIEEWLSAMRPGFLEDARGEAPVHAREFADEALALLPAADFRGPESARIEQGAKYILEEVGYPAATLEDGTALAETFRAMVRDEIERVADRLLDGKHERVGAENASHGRKLKPESKKPISTHVEPFLNAVAKSLSDSTKNSYRAELKRLQEVRGDKSIAAFEQDDVVAFMDHLIAAPGKHGRTMTRSSVVKALGHLKAFFGWAVMRKLAHTNPADGVTPPKARKGTREGYRRAFTKEELEKIFRQPIFVGCRSDHFIQSPGPHLVADGRFWLPLVALLSGGRLGELRQLRTTDLIEDSHIYFLNISILPEKDDDEEDQKRSVKTENAIRRIPVHPILQKLGFLDYCAHRHEHGERMLFEHRGYGQLYNDRVLVNAGVKEESTAFHSFRHTFKGMLRGAIVSDETNNRLMGHAPATTGEGYDQVLSIAEAKLFIEYCKPPLSLDHLVPYMKRNRETIVRCAR